MSKVRKDTPFWNTALSIEKRLDWLIANLTLEEKFKCMGSHVPELERLGIPESFVGGEAAHGVEARNDQNGLGTAEQTTSFPQPIGMSASWDTSLIKEAGEIVGTEARVLYHRHPSGGLSRWAPTVDMERDPRWGRNEEGYGEDPVLTGNMAGAYIEGLQGDDPVYLRTAATLKHFYANNAEYGRGWKNASIDPRNMYEYYLEPFRRCIVEHGAEAVMTAYNRINGTPGMLNSQVKAILKEQYGLKHAVCDGGAMELVTNLHHYFGTHAQTLAASLAAGVDAMSDPIPVVSEAAREAYELGLITEAQMDTAIRNMFRTKLRLGMFDGQRKNPYDRVTEDDLNSERAQEVCLRLSEESIVLLRNEGGFLPLSKDSCKRPAIVGPLSDVWYQDWYGGAPHHKSTLREGVEECLGIDRDRSSVKVSYADGWDRIRIRLKHSRNDKKNYIALASDGRLMLADRGELFVKEDWGEGRYNLRAESTERYVTISNETLYGENSQKRAMSASSEAAFDWFVLEIIHFIEDDNTLSSEETINSREHTVRISDRNDHELFAEEDGYIYSDSEGKGLEFVIETVIDGVSEVKRLAKSSDSLVLALGCHPMVCAKEEIDRKTIELPAHQKRIIEAVASIRADVVCLLFSNYPYNICPLKKFNALLWSATGSQDMGRAMARTIFGQNAPAGRLNQTWYASDADLAPIQDYDIIRSGRTYRYFEGNPLYCFGYGLTYSQFEYSELSVKLFANQLDISFNVKNTGSVISDEVAEIYGAAPASRVKKPQLQLLEFERLHAVKPNEVRAVKKRVNISEFDFYDCISGSLMLEEGNYRVMAGASSDRLYLEKTVFIPGERTGVRDASQRVRADHYDECENVEITEGIAGFTAVRAFNPEKSMTLTWRDCEINPIAETVKFMVKSVSGCRIRIFVNASEAACWNGDTKSYQPVDMFSRDKASRLEQKENIAASDPIFSEVSVQLAPMDKANIRNVELKISVEGDARFCWFRFS